MAEQRDVFSQSVRDVLTRYEDAGATAWQLVDALLASHSDYGGSQLLPLADRASESRAIKSWRVLLAGLFDLDAVERSSAETINGRLALLGLARLEPDVATLYRSAGFRGRLVRELGFEPETVFRAWARTTRPSQFLEHSVLRGHEDRIGWCAFSPDGTLLASASVDRTARLWNVSDGTERAVLRGHDSSVRWCSFSSDGSLLATASDDGTARLWNVSGGTERAVLHGHGDEVQWCSLSPDGRLVATTGPHGSARLWDATSGNERAVLHHFGSITGCAFSPDGILLATTGTDGTARLWDVSGGVERTVLHGHDSPVRSCAFSPDSSLLATAGQDQTVRLWDISSGTQHAVLPGDHSVRWCSFSPDGSQLATASEDGTARLWEVSSGNVRAVLRGQDDPVPWCTFRPDGSLLATTCMDGTARLWDVASGNQRAVLGGDDDSVPWCAFSPDGGLFATAGQDGTARIWEEVALGASLPEVKPDTESGADLLGRQRDVDAVANVIAATSTNAPLSIGLFGDWGSGKSFFISNVQRRVLDHARRAQQSRDSAYCQYVRNITFNAWHYAEANLWASIVSKIMDELARPREVTPQMEARLWLKLAETSERGKRLERARAHTAQIEQRRRLLSRAWILASVASGDDSLGKLQSDIGTIGGTRSRLLPTARWGIAIGAVALVVGVTAAALAGLLGIGRVFAAVAGAVAGLGVAVGAAKVLADFVAQLIRASGDDRTLDQVRSERGRIGDELRAVRATERELREDLADLASGRGLTRLLVTRGEDYRAQLGLISRIREDFEDLQKLLQRSAKREAEAARANREPLATATSETPSSGRLSRLTRRLADLANSSRGQERGPEKCPRDQPANPPPIERIVLYIDDLDRCPPKRVVEVLEAVHLILALELFIVVVAVDPRWLLQSLRLHYSQLLAASIPEPSAPKPSTLSEFGRRDQAGPPDTSADGPRRQDEPERPDRRPERSADRQPSLDSKTYADAASASEAWVSTPLHYLEKIIQIPFALRPASPSGVERLIRDLLPAEKTEAPVTPTEWTAPESEDSGAQATSTQTRDGSSDGGRRGQDSGTDGTEVPARRTPSLRPPELLLREEELIAAARMASVLATPRAIKKFTNLYRLVRAGLDDYSGELDRFLDVDETSIPEYEAVLVLLAVIVAFPEEATAFLLGLGESIDPNAEPNELGWNTHLETLEEDDGEGQRWADMVTFLRSVELTNADRSTCEPFRRWALEISRYSFDTGQRVFARQHARANRAPNPRQVDTSR